MSMQSVMLDSVPTAVAPATVVSARDVVRRYGAGDTAVDALRGVSVDIPRGRLTAAENIALPLKLAGGKPDSDWLAELIETVGLSDRLTHRPSELSGGQQQRVAVARALVSRPSVMFADEPTGNLDSTTSGEILGLLRDSVDALGQTTVMVTHDAQAAAIADRVLFLADGDIVRDLGPSSAHEILETLEQVSCR